MARSTADAPQNYKIYIVDDNKSVGDALTKVFRAAGFEVINCASGQEFFETFHIEPYVGVLLDLRMPYMSGLEVLKVLNDRGVSIPVIIYTAYADVEVTIQAFTDGAYTLIQKPASNTVLVDKVNEAISRSMSSESLVRLKSYAIQRLTALTKRESEVASLLVRGMTAPEIGESIHISARTVEVHRRNIYEKLEIRSTAELAKIQTIANLTI